MAETYAHGVNEVKITSTAKTKTSFTIEWQGKAGENNSIDGYQINITRNSAIVVRGLQLEPTRYSYTYNITEGGTYSISVTALSPHGALYSGLSDVANFGFEDSVPGGSNWNNNPINWDNPPVILTYPKYMVDGQRSNITWAAPSGGNTTLSHYEVYKNNSWWCNTGLTSSVEVPTPTDPNFNYLDRYYVMAISEDYYIKVTDTVEVRRVYLAQPQAPFINGSIEDTTKIEWYPVSYTPSHLIVKYNIYYRSNTPDNPTIYGDWKLVGAEIENTYYEWEVNKLFVDKIIETTIIDPETGEESIVEEIIQVPAIEEGSLVQFKLEAILFDRVGDEEENITIKESGTSNLVSYIRGNAPNSLSKIIFTPATTYIDNLYKSFNVVEGIADEGEGSFKYIGNAINISATIGDSIDGEIYERGVLIKWSRGTEYSGEIRLYPQPGQDLGDNIFSLETELNNINAPDLFNTLTNANIIFKIIPIQRLRAVPSVEIVGAVNLLSDGYFVLTKKPEMYSTGTTIPRLNYNGVINVNFTVDPPQVEANGIAGYDYIITNIQSRAATEYKDSDGITGIYRYGYKLYINDKLVPPTLFSQSMEAPDEELYDLENNIFTPSDFVPIDTVEANDPYSNIISLNMDIIKNKDFYSQYVNDGKSINTITTLWTLPCKVTVIDILGQESTNSYEFTLYYDFRVFARLIQNPIIHTIPTELGIVNKESFIWANSNKEISKPLCFHGQTTSANGLETTFDEIIFSWYPADNPNQRMAQPEAYTLGADGKYYLLAETASIQNYYTKYENCSYILRKYRLGSNGEILNDFTERRLSKDVDYFAAQEVITNSEGNKVNVLKYIGKYAVNLPGDLSMDELSYLVLLPAFVDNDGIEKRTEVEFSLTKGNIMNMMYEEYMLNEEYANSLLPQPIYIARFQSPNIIIDDIERPNGENNFAVVKYRIIDWGSTQRLHGVGINNNAGDSLYYQNFNTLSSQRFDISLKGKFGSSIDDTIRLQTVSYSNEDIKFQLQGEERFDSTGENEINNKNRFVGSITAVIVCNRSRVEFTDQHIAGQPELIYTSIQSSQYFTNSFILIPFFGSLSIRKNKVGINKSDLAWNEESLVIAAKERVENKYAGNDTFEYIVSIIGNTFTKMPAYDGEGGTLEETGQTNNGAYIGFHLSDKNGNISTVGGLGFDADGKCYIVEYNANTPKKIKLSSGSSGGSNGENLPIGAIMVFVEPTGADLTTGNYSFGPMDNWYWCNGKPIGTYSELYNDYIEAFGGVGSAINLGIITPSQQVCTPTLSVVSSPYYKYAIKVQ